MNDSQKQILLSWLKDAHAMELALVTTLEKQIKETEGKPDIRDHLDAHLKETKGHAEKVEACISRHGGDVSGSKDLAAKMAATLGGLGMSLADDALVKNLHSDYAAEHGEIASYTVIRAAAEELEDEEMVAVCDDILEDERRMAQWIEDQLPETVAEHVRSAA